MPAAGAARAASPVAEAGAWDVAATPGAAALEVGPAADRAGVVLDSTGATDTVGVAATAGAATELAAAGLDGAVLPVDDAWLSAAAVGWLDEPALAAGEA